MAPFLPSSDRLTNYHGSPDLDDTCFLTNNLTLNDSPPSLGSSNSDRGTVMASPPTPADGFDRVGRAYGSQLLYGVKTESNQLYGARGTQDPWRINNSAIASNSVLPMQQNGILSSMHNPATPAPNSLDVPQVLITERHMQVATGYAFYRGNGQYTRLIPIDEIPPIHGLRATQGPEGLIVLPTPHNHQPLGSMRFLNQYPFPLTPSATPYKPSAIQSEIDHIVSSSGPLRPPFVPSSHPPRREKIYCDKWVHDGVCAFAQQGCKYKHEMPRDVATQRALGLFHGLPAWYKREHNVELKTPIREGSGKVDIVGEQVKEGLRAGVAAMTPSVLSSWRNKCVHTGTGQSMSMSGGGRGLETPGQPLRLSLPSQNAFGNIARPSQSTATKNASTNSNNGGIASSIHAPGSSNTAINSYASPQTSQSQNPFGKYSFSTPTSPSSNKKTPAGDGAASAVGDGRSSGKSGNTYELLSVFEEKL